jgi:hypothetical protein
MRTSSAPGVQDPDHAAAPQGSPPRTRRGRNDHRRYPNIEPFRFAASNKPPLIQKLAVAIEQRQVRWPALSPAEGPRSSDVLTDELKRYEYEIHPGGRISHDAPSGFHDDFVVALALANEARIQGGPSIPMLPMAPAHPVAILRACPRELR